MLHFVYALVDPRTNSVGYIGLTNNPNERLQQHLQNIGGVNKQKYDWIQQLLTEHTEPKFRILETVYEGLKRAKQREKFWIQHYAMQQAPLVNVHHYHPTSDPAAQHTVKKMDLYGKGAIVYCLELETHSFPKIPVQRGSWLWDFPRITGSWLKKNDNVYWCSGQIHDPPQANDAWTSLGILPLEETLILRLLRGEIARHDIRAEDILPYEAGHSYTCYIPSVAYRMGKQTYLTQAFQHALVHLCLHGFWINKLYASAPYDTNETPMQHFVREHFFKSMPVLGQSAWMLSLQETSPSPAIQAYQNEHAKVLSRKEW